MKHCLLSYIREKREFKELLSNTKKLTKDFSLLEGWAQTIQ